MGEYNKDLSIENAYLEKTISFAKKTLDKEYSEMNEKKSKLLELAKDMYENGVHFSNDFEKLTDLSHYLNTFTIRTNDVDAVMKKIKKLEKLLKSPYFARIDFIEENNTKEQIYIGLGTLMDQKTYQTYVYDWRAPISSMFYRYETGKASYQAPDGIISGDITLKRQYEITDGKLQYFFESQVNIMDELLKKALSGNASLKMKTIVETIQREQDKIIRDMDNDLVIVQGVAGSGKTSVALHRVAYLMYQALTNRIGSKHIILISPNELFCKYISDVLPELGEENIATLTFEELIASVFKNSIQAGSRNELLEELITSVSQENQERISSNMRFKLSATFITILERYIKHFEHRMIPFGDILFNGVYVAKRELLRAELLNSRNRVLPLAKRLEQIENRILSRLQELRKSRLIKLENYIKEHTDYPLNAKSYSRLLATKQSSVQLKAIRKFTRIDYVNMYMNLFKNKELFLRLSKGLQLPSDIEQILEDTYKNLSQNATGKPGKIKVRNEDAVALMCLRLKMEGSNLYPDIKQIVVDEVQDYYPMHIENLRMLFTNARFTMVGDMNQTVERVADISIYDEMKTILNKRKTTTIQLNKSFRSSQEITAFSRRFLEDDQEIESFDRHGSPPEVICGRNLDSLDEAMIGEIARSQNEGYSSVAIICKSMKQAGELYKRLKGRVNANLICGNGDEMTEGVCIIPVYLVKGLEYDVVLVYGIDEENYRSPNDRRLLYIACTRALHRLSLFHTGKVSRLI